MLDQVASPRRQVILRLTWDDFVSAGDIHRAMPDVTFGAVSLHLRQMLDAGLIERKTAGKHRLYRANKSALGPVADLLEQMWDDALWKLKIAAELEAKRRGPRPARRGRTRRSR